MSANVLECYVIFLPCSHLKESKADWHGKNAKKMMPEHSAEQYKKMTATLGNIGQGQDEPTS